MRYPSIREIKPIKKKNTRKMSVQGSSMQNLGGGGLVNNIYTYLLLEACTKRFLSPFVHINLHHHLKLKMYTHMYRN